MQRMQKLTYLILLDVGQGYVNKIASLERGAPQKKANDRVLAIVLKFRGGLLAITPCNSASNGT